MIKRFEEKSVCMNINFTIGANSHFAKKLLRTVDKIKHDDKRRQGESPLWDDIAAFCAVLILNSLDKEANELLEAFFSACQSAQEQSISPDESLLAVPAETEWLEIFWNGNSNTDSGPRIQRPSNVPWPAWDSEKFATYRSRADFDPGQASFYEKWTDTDWMIKAIFTERGQTINIESDIDMHQWKESQDPWIVAICVCLLCRPLQGRIPSSNAVIEAYDALNRLFFEMPRRTNSLQTAYHNLPHRQMISPRIHFLLAMHLRREDDALKVAKAAARLDSKIEADFLQDFSLHDFLNVPQFHFLLQQRREESPIRWLDKETAVMNANMLLEALNRRASLGKQTPFLNVTWEELLRRFSEGLFATQRKKYNGVRQDDEQIRIESAADILLPPLTVDEIAEAESRLGPIPKDIKDMSLIARGFRGGWHFAAGGFPGIDKMCDLPVMDYEAYIHEIVEMKIVVKTEQREKRMPDGTIRTIPMHFMGYPKDLSLGNLLQSPGTVECDDYEHIIVRPETWKIIKKDQYVEGSYRYFHMAHWTDGPDQIYDSVRQWIEVMTREAELTLSFSEGGQMMSDGSSDEDEEYDSG